MNKIYLYFIAFIFLSCGKNSNPLFELKDSSSTGLVFENNLTYTEEFNPYTYRNFFNGAGVALGDINNDGLTDVYFTGNIVDNKLFINKGNWNFEDITAEAGVASPNVWSTGATFVDINSDGYLDIYVCKSGLPGGKNRHNELFVNQGDNTFVEEAEKYGLDIIGLSVQAAFFDYDKDGDLDCYLLNNSIRSVGAYDLIKDQRTIPSEDGNRLLENRDGKFVNVSKEAGIYSSAIGFGLGITLSDFNNDGWTDLFISNDFFEKDYLYINNQKGGFTEESNSYFTALSMGSMGADAADLDNDLNPDIIVTEMLPQSLERKKSKQMYESWDKHQLAVNTGYHKQFPRNVLQRNLDKKGFVEISRYAGVDATEWSWAALFFDMDNDGLKDIYISNGIYKDLLDRDYLAYMANEEKVRQMIAKDEDVLSKLIEIMPSGAVPNAVYKNRGDFSFEDVGEKWGLNTPSFSNGSAYGDLDNDGDLDLVVNNVNMPSFVYENKSETKGNNYVQLSLNAGPSNPFGVGSKIIAYLNDGNKMMAEQYPSRGFESSAPNYLHFGLGKATAVDSLKIYWPDLSESTLVEIPINTHTKLSKENIATQIITESIVKKESSESVELFPFTHKENTYVDFDKERLLPQMFSNEGPRIAKADINNDGLDDFYIGGAKGQLGRLLISEEGGYKIEEDSFRKTRESEDLESVFFDADMDGDLDLYVCSGGKDFNPNSINLQDHLYRNEKGTFILDSRSLSFERSMSTSVVRPYDFDQDGDTDLFVGERYQINTYGLPASGYILENDGQGHFKALAVKELQQIGLITDAKWADINGDGWNDLIIAGEWMPISVFENHQGKFKNATTKYGLEHSSGMWSSIELSDLNGDGQLDIIAGNAGQNGLYKPEMSLYLYDFDSNATVEQIMCYRIDGKDYPILDRDELISQLPSLKKKYLYYNEYAKADMSAIFDKELLSKAKRLSIDITASSVFLSNNNTYIQRDLPSEIQYSNIAAILLDDIDKDGIIDLLLGGNQYRIKPQFGPYDASSGWLLRGLKNDSLFKKPESLFIKGEIRDFETTVINNTKILITTINNESIHFQTIK